LYFTVVAVVVVVYVNNVQSEFEVVPCKESQKRAGPPSEGVRGVKIRLRKLIVEDSLI